MAGVSNIVGLPEVVHYGGAVEDRDSYTGSGAEAVAVGDLIRITSAGTVKLAEDGNGTIVGALHGIALGAVGASSTDICPVLLFADDTVISMPVADDTNWSDDYSTGVLYELDPASVSGSWALSTTTTNGVFQTVKSAKSDVPWYDVSGVYGIADDTDNNGHRVLCTVPTAVLEGVKGA